jgi:hypothetical protein
MHQIIGGGFDGDSRSTRKSAVMRARAGDTLRVPGSHTRTGLIVAVVGPNGAPPYVVKWLADGHIAMVTPDQYSRIVPAPRGLGQVPLADQ